MRSVRTITSGGNDVEVVVLHHIAADAHCKRGPSSRRWLAEEGVQVTGPPLPQLNVTELEYPFTEVSVPLNVAVPVTPAVCGELLTLMM